MTPYGISGISDADCFLEVVPVFAPRIPVLVDADDTNSSLPSHRAYGVAVGGH